MKITKGTDKNYSKVKVLRNNNECLFKGVAIKCSTRGKHKTENNHLIPKASYLERIAYKDNVMIFDFENRDYIKNGEKLVRRNIKTANTFRVLCGNHDKYLFDEIENGNKFDENNDKQLFQFALRAYIFYFSEQEIKSQFDNIFRKAKSLEDLVFYVEKKRLDKYKTAVSEERWDSVETKIIRVRSKAEFISCYAGIPSLGFVFPFRIQPGTISLNIFPLEDDTIILLSYLKDDIGISTAPKFCEKLVKLSQKNEKRFLKYINKFIIAFDHNIAINPVYWEQLSDRERKDFYEMAHIFPNCKFYIDFYIGCIKLKFKKSCINLFSK